MNCVEKFIYVQRLIVFFFFSCRPVFDSHPSMYERSRPLQFRGASAHSQAARRRQRWRNWSEWECGGEHMSFRPGKLCCACHL